MPRMTAAAALIALALAAPAWAQGGRVTGVVRDINGEPVRGATIRAYHADSSPHERTSTTDDRGRFVMLGLRVAQDWEFTAEAPGFYPEEGVINVRAAATAPVVFTLRRDPGPMPGALTKDIAAQLTAAAALRDRGRYDDAIAAYTAIQGKNERLTSVNLVLAGIYRLKADTLQAAAERRPLLERAAAAYGEVLKTDADHVMAKAEMAEVQAALTELK